MFTRALVTNLIVLGLTMPVIGVATWLYLRRRTLQPRMRIASMGFFFALLLLSWPTVLVVWHLKRQQQILEAVPFRLSAEMRYLIQVTLLWFVMTLAALVQFVRLCRAKGALNETQQLD